MNEMEKMSKEPAMLELVISELIEIKMHMCNGRTFEAGVGLGGLINSMINRKNLEEENDCEEDDEDYEDEDDIDYEFLYKEKLEKIYELEEKINLKSKTIKEHCDRICKLENALITLLHKDHVFSSSIPLAIEALRRPGQTNLEMEKFMPGYPNNIKLPY